MDRIKKYIVDRWLTWRTGKDKPTRDWEAWYETNVVYRAGTVSNMFMHFKHVIVVSPNTFFDLREPFAYVPCEDARQYFWPQRPVTETCVWRFERVMWNQWTEEWDINGMGDRDKVFVATNNDADAIMIALKYGS